MSYPHLSADCTEYHHLVRDFRAAARPAIVVLCGSTRFYDAFQKANYDLTMDGHIVLSVGFYPHATPTHRYVESGSGFCATCEDMPGEGEHRLPVHGEGVGHNSQQKFILDELHKRKIDLADHVFVLNVDGYIGESTRSEIEYAQRIGRPVEYLEPVSG